MALLRRAIWSRVTARTSRAARSGRDVLAMNCLVAVISASAAASPPLTSSIRSSRSRSVTRAVTRSASPAATTAGQAPSSPL
ncbi:MAG TPA: hypothetical protein VGM12_12630 [Trebonia sp.]